MMGTGSSRSKPKEPQGATGGHSYQGPGNYRFLFSVKSTVASTIPLDQKGFEERYGTKLANIYGIIPYDIKLDEMPSEYVKIYSQDFFRRCFIIEAVISSVAQIDKIKQKADEEETFQLLDTKLLQDENETAPQAPKKVEEFECKFTLFKEKWNDALRDRKSMFYLTTYTAYKKEFDEIFDGIEYSHKGFGPGSIVIDFDLKLQNAEQDMKLITDRTKKYIGIISTPTFSKAGKKRKDDEKDKVIEYSKMKRRISENKLEAYERMCSALKRNSSEIVDVAATKSSKDDYEFVVITPDPARTKRNTENSFPVMKEYPVKYRDVVNEGKLVQDKITELRRQMDRDQRNEMKGRVRKALMKYSSHLMDQHKNLNAIHFSPLKSVGFLSGHLDLKDEPCIVLFVNIKFSKRRVPIGEKDFPSELDGVPVDVRESYIIPLTYIGDKIASPVARKYATLGPVVNFPDQSIGFLTSMHAVIANGDMSFIGKGSKINVFKPSQYNEILSIDKILGYVEEFHYKEGKVGVESGFEVALIKFYREMHPRDAVFQVAPENGNLHFNKAQYFHGIQRNHFNTTVFKFGAASGMTKGIFDSNYANINRLKLTNEHIGIQICDQISILGLEGHKFADSGDSGAIVVLPFMGNPNNLWAVGLVTGQMRTGQYLVSPIAPILGSFPGFELRCYSMETD